MQFRLAQHSELPQIVHIYNEIIPSRLATADLEPVSVADREAWFNSFTQTHPLWVILNDAQEIIGWVGLEPFYGRPAYEHTAEISIYIDEKGRHQGVGTAAISFVEQQVKQLGISAIVCYIFGHNQPSLKLFEKFNYQEWGRLPRVAELDGQQRDLVIMGKRYDEEQ
ncbi:MAG: GNAT family N-acetyltransferase [Lactobacillus sp.]|jgi:phosphinothricin acetyltransferase|nr:GNAT family N-acetyltransferase [Lactobacillus sp.]MCH3990104.1 GNAT family N-acetyltransferase [Lactobacillus sp.]MCH4069182.1 GNAT family N-acetyltransferase [Lactobacillus sp.]MCI1303484.1 GNAT family N-acetyltransferase [Lactobacillus sp.]MCI1329660.1 GNAT family N-acetyltransferase [Lactobacillus sp.]